MSFGQGACAFLRRSACCRPVSGKKLILKRNRSDAVSAIVEPLYLFDLASTQARYLTIRQAAVAENIANVNTPGYKALEVAPFSAVYDTAGLQMATTKPDHLQPDLFDPASISGQQSAPWEVTYSGNSVSLEQQMLEANQINRSYSLNMALSKIFNQMLAMSVKGPS